MLNGWIYSIDIYGSIVLFQNTSNNIWTEKSVFRTKFLYAYHFMHVTTNNERKGHESKIEK